MTLALQVLISGLAAGGVYGLFAAGHSLVYRLTGIVNFAFGPCRAMAAAGPPRCSSPRSSWGSVALAGGGLVLWAHS